MTYVPSPPCPVCHRCHRGPRCLPSEARSVTLTVTIPGYLHRALFAQVPMFQRSAYVAAAIEKELQL